jgi:hypothetical protein
LRPTTIVEPVPMRVPAKTSSPTVLATGRGSPVIEAWSTSLRPSRTSPSAPSLVDGDRQGRTIVYSLYDNHVAQLLDEAVFHAEHLRLGAPDRQRAAG